MYWAEKSVTSLRLRGSVLPEGSVADVSCILRIRLRTYNKGIPSPLGLPTSHPSQHMTNSNAQTVGRKCGINFLYICYPIVLFIKEKNKGLSTQLYCL
jgi:hypothetical protein